jgi:hypothetical protein
VSLNRRAAPAVRQERARELAWLRFASGPIFCDVTTPDHRSARRSMTARVFRLGEEPGDDLSAVTTVAERIDMVAELSRRMWELTGQPFPSYTRATMPGRVIRSE